MPVAGLRTPYWPGKPVTLRTLRLRKGLSQAQLAEAIGTQQPHIAAY